MALKLTGTPKSSCTLKVLLTLAEKGISNYEFINTDLMKGEQKAGIWLPLHVPYMCLLS